MNGFPARLTCEQCRQRKTKCDKNVPCTACTKAGLSCNAVQRARLPRGRSGKVQKQNTMLESRVARMERLVQQCQAQVSSDQGSSNDHSLESGDEALSGNSDKPSQKIRQFVASDFWTALTREITGLRDTLEDSDEDLEQETSNGTTKTYTLDSTSSLAFLLPNHGQRPVDHQLQELALSKLEAKLLTVYRHRVDAVFKVLHWPTVTSDIENANVHGDRKLAAVEALKHAMYFTTLCSLNDSECEVLGLDKRGPLLQFCRERTETWISRSNLYSNADLRVLQAFVIYLVGLRTCMSCASTWALVAIAIRVATAHGLNADDGREWSLIDREVRRRLWFSIGIIDTQTALDRGSPPLLSYSGFECLPSNVNDADLTATGPITESSPDFTEMSFPRMTYEAMICQKEMCQESVRPQESWFGWELNLLVEKLRNLGLWFRS